MTNNWINLFILFVIPALGKDESISPRLVVLLGDSLINQVSFINFIFYNWPPLIYFNEQPCQDHDLVGKIIDRLPSGSWERDQFWNSGVNSDTISRIDDRVQFVLDDAMHAGLWATILFWDSDCSDVDETWMTTEEIGFVRGNYTARLVSVCEKIIAAGSLLAIAGPGVLGEGPVNVPPSHKTWCISVFVIFCGSTIYLI